MKHFNRRDFFFLGENCKRGHNFLPLSWIDEEGYFTQFPGETWNGKTWLEQNKILVDDPQFINYLMNQINGKIFLRYIDREAVPVNGTRLSVDEVGYLFYPAEYEYSFENYYMSFSKKTRKNFSHELKIYQEKKVSYRYNHLPDIDWMFEKNLSVYKEDSYFYDHRFLGAFIDMVEVLNRNRLLLLTSVLINGRIAAVDVGTLWKNTYTVMAGGVDSEFQGIAKLINFHHIRLACEKRLDVVDFLCGDFNWKSRFHLSPRPLFKLSLSQADHFLDFDFVEDRIPIAA
jgi:hypothetical protein